MLRRFIAYLLIVALVSAGFSRFFIFAGFAADVVTDAASGTDCRGGGGTAGGFDMPMSLALCTTEDSGVTCCVLAVSFAGCAASGLFEWETAPPFARVLNQCGAENPAATRTTITISAPSVM